MEIAVFFTFGMGKERKVLIIKPFCRKLTFALFLCLVIFNRIILLFFYIFHVQNYLLYHISTFGALQQSEIIPSLPI